MRRHLNKIHGFSLKHASADESRTVGFYFVKKRVFYKMEDVVTILQFVLHFYFTILQYDNIGVR